jgi:hypothetical protein
MAFYIKIEGKIFKVKKDIVLGRGVPFDNLVDHRDIARAHCRIEFDGGDFYITDLKTQAGTFVNGKRLKSNKRTKIHDFDSIAVGEHQLFIQKEAFEESAETLTKFVTTLTTKKMMLKTLLKWFAILVVLGGYLVISRHTGSDKPFEMSMVINELLFFVAIAAIPTFIGLLIGTFFTNFAHPKRPQEISVGNTGITLFFKKGNMSIPFDQMKVRKTLKSTFVIEAYGTSYLVSQIKDIGNLYEQIEKSIGDNTEDIRAKNLKVMVVVVAVVLLFKFAASHEVQLVLLSVGLALGGVLMLLSCCVDRLKKLMKLPKEFQRTLTLLGFFPLWHLI